MLQVEQKGKAYQIEYSLGDKKGFYTHITDNTTLYELHYSALSTGYNRYLNQAKRAIQSFRFIEPAFTVDTSYEDKKSGARFFYPHEWKVQPADSVNDIVIGSSAYPVFVGYSGGFEPTGSFDNA